MLSSFGTFDYHSFISIGFQLLLGIVIVGLVFCRWIRFFIFLKFVRNLLWTLEDFRLGWILFGCLRLLFRKLVCRGYSTNIFHRLRLLRHCQIWESNILIWDHLSLDRCRTSWPTEQQIQWHNDLQDTWKYFATDQPMSFLYHKFSIFDHSSCCSYRKQLEVLQFSFHSQRCMFDIFFDISIDKIDYGIDIRLFGSILVIGIGIHKDSTELVNQWLIHPLQLVLTMFRSDGQIFHSPQRWLSAQLRWLYWLG